MISDDDLLLYHYDDGLDAGTRRRIGEALSAQPALAARLQALRAQLDAAAALPDVPVPAGAQRRWQESLDRAVRREVAAPDSARPRFFAGHGWRTGAAAFATVLLVAGVALGVLSRRESAPDATPGAPMQLAGNQADASRYERGLQWHLAQTERQLATLGSTRGAERARLIDKVVEQNRLFAIAAERAKEPRLARVLRSFTPILESLTEEHAGEDDFEGGLAQLNFEMKIVQARLATATSHLSPAPNQVLAL